MIDAVPAIIEDVGQQSQFFAAHADYWKLVKKYLNGNEYGIRDEEYWENLVHDTDILAKKYNNAYVRGLLLNLLDEIDRRSRLERSRYESSVN